MPVLVVKSYKRCLGDGLDGSRIGGGTLTLASTPRQPT